MAQFLVAQAHGIALEEMRAPTRGAPHVASARQVAIYLTRRVFGLSLRALAREFRRQPSTIDHALGAVARRRESDAEFGAMLGWLESLLRRAAGRP